MPPVNEDDNLDGFLESEDDPKPIKTAEQLKKEADDLAESERLKKEEEEKSKGKSDDEPDFSREHKKKTEKKEEKPSKDESNAILRKQRDDLAEKNKVFTEVFGENSPSTIKPIWDFVAESIDGGIVTPETVQETIESIRSQQEEIETLRAQVAEKDAAIEKLDIRSSPVFNKKYVEPYKEALSDLFLEFADVGSDKKIIGEKSAIALRDFITDPNNASMDTVSMKAALKQYAESYHKETGEDAKLPSVTDMMKSWRNFQSKRTEMNDAYSNWGIKKKEDEERANNEQLSNQESQARQSKKARSDMASKAFREFPIDELSGFMEERDVRDLFKKQYNAGEDILSGKSVPTYDKVITSYVKADILDKILPRYQELLDLEKRVKEGERNGLHGTKPIPAGKGQEKDWTED